MRSRLGRWFLQLMGWRVDGERPLFPKYVAPVAPHTSNWDFAIGLALSWDLGIKAGFVGKEGLFRPPFGWLFRALGGHPVKRDRSENLVEAIAEVFNRSESFVLAIAPEGTRDRTDVWKSGFYHVAALAKVPIVPVALDYDSKTATVGAALVPSGDLQLDMGALREFYRDKHGRHPNQFGPVQLESELDS